MLGSSPPPKQPGDLLIPCSPSHRGREYRWGGFAWKDGDRGRTRCLCYYPVTEFPVWPRRLPWSPLCSDIYSDTDSDQCAVIDSDKKPGVSVFSLFLLSVLSVLSECCSWSPVSHPVVSLSAHSEAGVLCVRGAWLPSAVGFWTSQLVDNYSGQVRAYNIVPVDSTFDLHSKKTQGEDKRHKEHFKHFKKIKIHKGLGVRHNK